ncbi:carbon-nitrogen hydrolase [Ruficoccus sp. ZRK36]|uniref:carbon-nitrogen hydrolase n=1 Tax=Ruficoccus sp. ZRK36 TaxID=2866311 RepID=UPI001C733A98|nr:carbon-nitrogen hydrolase [Ruficoccus sp. ZRK36]QYY36527.1 carbon-nitrogen hydrolase [Ruficoccus sp. ZRK36]
MNVTLGLIQMAMAEAPADNLATAEARIREAAAQGAQVICLPEMFTTLYFCRTQDPDAFDLAEPMPGPTTDVLCALARELQVVIVAPMFEKRMTGLYHNTAAVIDADGTLLGKYRKMHIPQDPGFEEKFYFTPGDLGFRAWDTRYGRIGVLICWDQWYPEAARLTALAGAQILFYPTAIGWLPAEKAELGAGQLNAWQTIQCSHAVANGCAVAAINRVGTEGETEFWGHSFVADTYGQRVAEAGESEKILLHTVDIDALEEFRRWWPFLRDRRIDAYGEITKRAID